jgi:hypothetical protein
MIRYVSQNFDGPTSGLSATPGEMNLVDALRIGALDKDHLAYLVGRPEFTRPLYQRESEQGYRLVGKRNVINDIIGKLNSTQEE